MKKKITAIVILIALCCCAAAQTAAAVLPLFYFVYQACPQPGDADCSGDITPEDARLILRAAVGIFGDSGKTLSFITDINADGVTGPDDARIALRMAVGLDNCPEPDTEHIYEVRVNAPVKEEGSGIIADIYKYLGASGKEKLPSVTVTDPVELDSFTASLDGYITQKDEYYLPQDFVKRYGSDFFAERDLIICFMEEGSGSTAHVVRPLAEKDGKRSFAVCPVVPEGCTCDMAWRFLFIPVPKPAGGKELPAECVWGDSLREADCAENYYFTVNAWAYAYEMLVTGEEYSDEVRQASVFSLMNAQDGGYLWECADNGGLDVSEWDAAHPDPSLAGSPGIQVFSVGSDKPGDYTAKFVLKRSWEKTAIKEMTVNIRVKK